MADSDRMKRRLLDEAVQENLDTLRGIRRRPARRDDRSAWLRSSVFLLIPTALFGASLLLPDAQRGGAALEAAANAPAPVAPQAAPAQPAGLTSTLPLESVVEPVSLPAPAALDPAVFSLAVRRVVVDPGHGGDSHGAEAPGACWRRSSRSTSRSACAPAPGADFEVVMTRERRRGPRAGRARGGSPTRRGPTSSSRSTSTGSPAAARGVETYYLGPTEDPFLKRLAAAENRDSGYSHGRHADGCSRASTPTCGQASRAALPRACRASCTVRCAHVNPELRDRGVKTAPVHRPGGHRDAGDPGRGLVPVERGRGGAAQRSLLSSTHRRRPGGRHPGLLQRRVERRAERTLTHESTERSSTSGSTSARRAARSRPPTGRATWSRATSAGRSTWWRARCSRNRCWSAARRSTTARCSTSTGRSSAA